MRAALGLLAILFLAGCAKPTSESQSDASTPATGASRLVGLVVDDDHTPLGNATVRLPLLERSTQTALGRFAFEDVPPGRQRIEAELAGHRPLNQSVFVTRGETAEVVLVLDRLPETLAYNNTLIDRLFMGCAWTTPVAYTDNGSACGDANSDTVVNLTFPRDWAQILVEIAWKREGFSTNDEFRADLRWRELLPAGAYQPHYYARVDGGSPLRVALLPSLVHEDLGGDEETPPAGIEGPLELSVNKAPMMVGDVDTMTGFTYQQSFTVYTTVFYHLPHSDVAAFTAIETEA